MATRFYLQRDSSSAPVSPAVGSLWDVVSDNFERHAARLNGSHANAGTETQGHVDTNPTYPSTAAGRDVIFHQWVSTPIADALTISGTIHGQMLYFVPDAAADHHTQLMVRVVSGDGATQRGVLYAGDQRTGNVDDISGSDFRNCQVPAPGATDAVAGVATLTPIAALAGDRLVLEVGVRANNSVGGYTAYLIHGELSSYPDLASGVNDVLIGAGPVQYNPWLELSFDFPGPPVVIAAPLVSVRVSVAVPAVSDGLPIVVAAPLVSARVSVAVPTVSDGLPVEVAAPLVSARVSVGVPTVSSLPVVIVVPLVVARVSVSAPTLIAATVTLVDPADGAVLPSLSPGFTASVVTADTAASVEFQYAVDNVFTAPQSTTAVVSAGQVSFLARAEVLAPLDDDTTYFWRARAVNAFGETSWTEVRSFAISVQDGGALVSGSWNVTADTTAPPHLWFTTPTRAKVGDRLLLYGTAFGYNVLSLTLGGVTATVLDWDIDVAANDDAFTADRVIDATTGECSPVHHVVDFAVPSVPPPGGPLQVTGS